jgi:FixJ family two-component response regulator
MPDMNGLEFLQKIKQLYPHVVLIMLTAVSDVNIAIDAINDIGIFKFILKPINYKILEDSINSAISHNYDNNNEKNINDVIRSKDSVLRDLERQYPGISSMPPRDKDGYILLEI